MRTHQGNELTRNSLGYPRAQSPQLAEPLWTDPWLEDGGGIVVCQVISTENAGEKNDSPKLPPYSSHAWKSHNNKKTGTMVHIYLARSGA